MPKRPLKLPVVLSPEEVVHFLACVASTKRRAILTTIYASGLRVSEAVALRPADIDSSRMVLRVDQGKGRKDRYALEYLGRYTHRVAISNSRLVDCSDGSVAFRWKDYRHDSKPKVMRLPAAEFTRRFLLHMLPSGLQRIRHYGLLANRTREAKLERCCELLSVASPAPNKQDQHEDYRDRHLRLPGVSLLDCPACKNGRMVCIETLLPKPPAQGPPDGRV